MNQTGTRIHPTAVVSPQARLGQEVSVGPYSVIADHVEIGDGTAIASHVVIHDFVRLGERNSVAPHAVLGGPPQDLSFDGAETRVEIGDDNVIREAVTIHRATSSERVTRLGSGCFLMVNAHIGHDCSIGNGVILTNDVNLAGHVTVGERAVIAGAVQIHQHVRVGRLAMLGGLAGVGQDILPYSLVFEIPAVHYRLNTIGLKRAGIEGDRYKSLERAFRLLRAGRKLEELERGDSTEEVEHLRQWLSAPSKRGIAKFLRPKSRTKQGAS